MLGTHSGLSPFEWLVTRLGYFEPQTILGGHGNENLRALFSPDVGRGGFAGRYSMPVCHGP
tara:strand:- start:10831 stop:11013 length:183 start_codon:yes stop_codon:yes gene_type:complete